jgi:Tol biopolymer transport system component
VDLRSQGKHCDTPSDAFEGKNNFPIWTADSRYVTFQSDREGVPSVFKRTQPTFTIGKTVQLPIAVTIQPGAPSPRNFDITPDGKQLIFVVPAPAAQTNVPLLSQPEIDFVVNWFTELLERVTAK